MDARVRDLVTGLRAAESVEPQCSVVDDWVAARDIGRLREAASSLAEPAAPGWQVSSVLDYLVRRLALTPGAEFAGIVHDLARRLDAPYLASLVASGQPPEVAASLVDGGAFGACLAQELVLRSSGAEFEPLWRRLAQRGHPLAWLPLHLTEIEEGVELPHYTERGTGFGTPFGPQPAMRQPYASLPARIERDVTTAAIAERASTAFADWVENSNGMVEVRVFELAPEDEGRALAGALVEAGLECLAGATSVRVSATGADDAFALAFAAASTGGAYTRGRHGAYGRLDAWKTIAALVGAEPDAPFESVNAAATAARWFRFESDAPWFCRVAWDVGLVVQREDGRSLAVLAATDED